MIRRKVTENDLHQRGKLQERLQSRLQQPSKEEQRQEAVRYLKQRHEYERKYDHDEYAAYIGECLCISCHPVVRDTDDEDERRNEALEFGGVE